MNLDSIKQKLADLFDDSGQQQLEARQKLQKIIAKLSDNKESVKLKMLEVGEEDQTSDAFLELENEYNVISKLLKKAKKQYSEISTVDESGPPV